MTAVERPRVMTSGTGAHGEFVRFASWQRLPKYPESICIQSLPEYLYLRHLNHCRFARCRPGTGLDSHGPNGQPTGRRSLSCSCRNNGSAPAGCASFCFPNKHSTKRHRLTACPIPEVFFPSPLDMVSRLHWGLSCGVSPKFSISASFPRACMGGQPTLRRAAFLRCLLVRLASHSTECLIQSLVK